MNFFIYSIEKLRSFADDASIHAEHPARTSSIMHDGQSILLKERILLCRGKITNPKQNGVFNVNTAILNQLNTQTTKKVKKTLAYRFKLHYIALVLAKSNTSRDKLKTQKANNSTPKIYRAFFVCSVYAPIQYNLCYSRLFSMVVRNGQPLAVGCFPFETVCHPVTCYRPIVTNLAVVLKNIQKDTDKMKSYIFKFLSLTTGKTTPCIIATSETEARKKLAKNDRLTLVYRTANPFPILSHARPMAFANWGVWYA